MNVAVRQDVKDAVESTTEDSVTEEGKQAVNVPRIHHQN